MFFLLCVCECFGVLLLPVPSLFLSRVCCVRIIPTRPNPDGIFSSRGGVCVFFLLCVCECFAVLLLPVSSLFLSRVCCVRVTC